METKIYEDFESLELVMPIDLISSDEKCTPDYFLIITSDMAGTEMQIDAWKADDLSSTVGTVVLREQRDLFLHGLMNISAGPSRVELLNEASKGGGASGFYCDFAPYPGGGCVVALATGDKKMIAGAALSVIDYLNLCLMANVKRAKTH
jgi:hypothetical protein